MRLLTILLNLIITITLTSCGKETTQTQESDMEMAGIDMEMAGQESAGQESDMEMAGEEAGEESPEQADKSLRVIDYNLPKTDKYNPHEDYPFETALYAGGFDLTPRMF